MQEAELTCDNFGLLIFENQVHISVFSSNRLLWNLDLAIH